MIARYQGATHFPHECCHGAFVFAVWYVGRGRGRQVVVLEHHCGAAWEVC